MRNTRREMMLYSFSDFTGIAAHLEKMAANGWMLEKIGHGLKYRRIEPAKLHFAVTYFPAASGFDAGLAEGQDVFLDYCSQAGWQLAAKSAQMQVFYSTKENPVPIETDAAVQVENIHQAMKKNYLPSNIVLLLLSVFQIVLHCWRLWDAPVYTLTESSFLFVLPCYLLLLVLEVSSLAGYYRWYRRATAAVETDGTLVPSRSHPKLQAVALVILSIGTLAWLGTLGDGLQVLTVLLSFAMIALLILLSNGITTLLKHLEVSAKVNRIVTLVSIFVLSFALIGGMVAYIIHNDTWKNGHILVGTYESNGMTWDIYADPIPLTIQDLVETNYDGWSTQADERGNFLLRQGEYCQRGRVGDTGVPDLNYTIFHINANFPHDVGLEEYFREAERDSHPEVNMIYYYEEDIPGDWGAETVYRFYDEDGPRNTWLLCWSDRVVEIRFDWDWEITPEMKAITGEKLKNA